jgi:hypothetical protein
LEAVLSIDEAADELNTVDLFRFRRLDDIWRSNEKKRGRIAPAIILQRQRRGQRKLNHGLGLW